MLQGQHYEVGTLSRWLLGDVDCWERMFVAARRICLGVDDGCCVEEMTARDNSLLRR